jgi:hydroxyacylglutathione hydrolase/adenylyltransferase/sulfurtransferase
MTDFDEASLDVTPEQAAEAMAEGSAQVVDVREQYEWDAGHIEGVRHIPLGSLQGAAGSIERGRPVIFSCRTGARSTMAAQAFRGAGYRAFNLEGGIEQWVAEGRPITPEDGYVAAH